MSGGRWVVVVARIDAHEDGTSKYDEPEGTLHVDVEPLRRGTTGAREAMDRLYGSIA